MNSGRFGGTYLWPRLLLTFHLARQFIIGYGTLIGSSCFSQFLSRYAFCGDHHRTTHAMLTFNSTMATKLLILMRRSFLICPHVTTPRIRWVMMGMTQSSVLVRSFASFVLTISQPNDFFQNVKTLKNHKDQKVWKQRLEYRAQGKRKWLAVAVVKTARPILIGRRLRVS